MADGGTFVDGRALENGGAFHGKFLSPEYTLSPFTGHMTAAALLALFKTPYCLEPAGQLMSLRGYDLEFHRRLSAGTEALVGQAVEYFLRLVKAT